MQSKRAIYHAISPTFLVVNEKAYKKIKPYIMDAVVSKHQDLYYLEKRCFATRLSFHAIFLNGVSIDQKQACFSCKHRVRRVTGSCSYNYQSIKQEKYEDFSYLIEKCIAFRFKEDKELEYYVNLIEHPISYIDFDEEEMTFQEYRTIVNFVERLDRIFDRLHRVKRWLKRST